MLEDLEFIIGDRDHLLGRCIIFTTNLGGSENPFNPRHPALAVAADPTELADILSSIIPFPDEMRRRLNSKIKESAELWARTMFGQRMYQTVKDLMSQGLAHIEISEDLKKQLEEEMSSIPDGHAGEPHHPFFVPLVGFDPEAIEPYKDAVDLARAPEVPNISFAGLVLSGHAQHYLAEYLMQKEGSAGKGGPGGGRAERGSCDIPKDAFLEGLKAKVSAIMYAQETGDDFENLLSELVDMTNATIYLRDALNLARVARSNHAKKIEIMELYLKRMKLLAEEKYEEIPAVDVVLKSLDRQIE